MSSPTYNCRIVVDVYPTGTPGKVRYQVTDAGPVHLTPEEAVTALRVSAELIELGIESGRITRDG